MYESFYVKLVDKGTGGREGLAAYIRDEVNLTRKHL